MSIVRNKKIIAAIIALMVIVIFIALLEKTNRIHLFSNTSPHTIKDGVAKTTSEAESAQENFSSGSDRQPQSNTKNEAYAVDTKGSTSESTPPSQWIASTNKAIVVHAPSSGNTLNSGGSFFGTSSLKRVSFRLNDDVSGMIAQGELTVTNGAFSGKLTFTTSAKNGRLDVYGTRDDGVEFDNIEIPVVFK